MRILVTNDDGIDSPGLQTMARRMTELGDVTVFAPSHNMSGASAAIGHIGPGIPDVAVVDRVELPEVDFTVECSKGFYVRTYAPDIGQTLGCGAHLSALRRVRSGRFTLDRAISVDSLKTAPRDELYKQIISLAEISLMRGA